MPKFLKIVALTVLTSLILSLLPVSLTGPKQARAQFTVVDPSNLVPNTISSIQNIGQLTQMLLQFAQKFVLENLRKRLLDMMVDQIINWIQGGGKPKFVTDWGGFLEEAANIAVGDFVEEIGAGFLCRPFNFQIQVSLLPVPRFTQRITCTLDDIVGNVENFYNDFRNGGWLALNYSIQPQNNYFGALLMANQELDERKSSANEAARNEALAGGGFLNIKRCQEDPGDPNGTDIDGDGKKGDIADTCEATTPGQVIGGLTTKAIGSDIDYILNATELTPYINAIANAAVNRLIIEGVEGIRGLTTPNAPRGGTIRGGVGVTCAGLTGQVLQTCQNYSASSNNTLSNAKTNTENQIQFTLGPRQQAQNLLDSSLKTLEDYQTKLQGLLTSFNGKFLSTCPARDTNIAAIRAEQQWASSTILALIDDKNKNQPILDNLNKTRDDLSKISPTDWAGFSAITTQVQSSGALDPESARQFKIDIEEKIKNFNVSNRTSQNLTNFNRELTLCP